jgi:hypothetical protein
MMTDAEHDKVYETLVDVITPEGVHWKDIVAAVNASGVRVKNWLEVRGIIQWMKDNAVIKRTDDIHVEVYVWIWEDSNVV